MLAKEPIAVCFTGIWGMGGIGKTTIARAIFDELIGEFEGGCFLRDVCKRDMVSLQKILISEVLKLEHVHISDIHQGSSMIMNTLCSKRVLLVLDDVNDKKQLESLSGEREWFGDGSRIVITTRDKHVLNKVNEIYELDTLSDSEATQLFWWHAFKESHPTTENFVELSNRVVKYACGLPLALEVLGSYLCGRERDDWESALDRLKDTLEDKIFVALEISFDGLENIQKDIFLDIACFFRWHREDTVKRMLTSFGFHPVDGITVLIQKTFLYILNGNIHMHDLIQELGWNIVCRKANKELGRYNRLWRNDDIVDVLTNNTGTSEIECLVLRKDNFELNEGAFRNMNKLRLLDFYVDNFLQAPNYLPNSLRWLCWNKYPARSLPENFKPRNLVCLALPDSKIVRTPDISVMPNLEILELPCCTQLLEVHSSIGVHKKLVNLNLNGCSRLKKFPRIIEMESLETFDFSGCYQLQAFPEIHGNMSHSRFLNLKGTNIGELPWSLGKLTNLRWLNLELCRNLRALPSSLFGLKYLEHINMSCCSNLEYIFENLDSKAFDCFGSQLSSLKQKRVEYHVASKVLHAFLSLPSLQTLDMSFCNVSELIIPESIGCLSTLQKLNLSGNHFVSLPESFNRFTCLQVLKLYSCEKLEAVPELPSSITELLLDGCGRLTRILNLVDLLGQCKKLRDLSIMGCCQLCRTQDIYHRPQTNALRQRIPEFLSAFWNWQSVSNVLHRRQDVVQINFPGDEIPDWLYHSSTVPLLPLLTLTLSPSWYNDKLRGFVLCAVSRYSMRVATSNGVLASMRMHRSRHTNFVYIPINKITSDKNWKNQKDCCLFWVNFHTDTSWGIRLLYDGEVDMDINDLRIANHYGPMACLEKPKLEVCVGL